MEQDRSELVLGAIHRGLDAPLYAQIQRDIEVAIATGRLGAGDLVPGEVDLADRYGVSRVTVRQALRELVAEGLLYRVQGKGTYIAPPMIQRAEPNITSFFYEMLESGRNPSSRSWSEVGRPDPETARTLQIGGQDPVIITRRVRYVNDEPIAYQVNVTRHALCPGLEREDFTTQSYQYTLEVKYGVRIAQVEESLASVMPDPETVAYLHLAPTHPALVDVRLLRGIDGRPIGSSRACFRGDRYTYKLLRRLSPLED